MGKIKILDVEIIRNQSIVLTISIPELQIETNLTFPITTDEEEIKRSLKQYYREMKKMHEISPQSTKPLKGMEIEVD